MSNDLNQCSFIGRLGSDPEVRYSSQGKAISSFSIAVGSQWKDKQTGEKQESTEWVNITAFDKLAEICGEYLHKGAQVFIQGRIKTDKYDKDGQTRYSTKIVAEQMQMLGGKNEGKKSEFVPSAKTASSPKAMSNFDNFDDDIPF